MDIFTALPREARERFRAEYLAELESRNGLPDGSGQRFTVRERYFAEVEARPVRRSGPAAVDQATFRRNEVRKSPEAGLDERTLWALAVAKSNRSERFGVEYALALDGPGTDLQDPLTFIQIEEFYHTRILRDAVETVGLQMEMRPPHPLTALTVKAMARLPHVLANVLILCAELAGVAAFRMLKQKAQALFADQPVPRARLEQLFDMILTDEVGHVRYVRSTLGPLQLAVARALLPVVVRALISDVPELSRLFGYQQLMAEIRRCDLSAAPALSAPATPVGPEPGPITAVA
jgi:hypothetical protein